MKRLMMAAALLLMVLSLAACSSVPALGPADTLTLRVKDDAGAWEDITCWRNEAGAGFFFLPSYAALDTAQLLSGGEPVAAEELDLSAVTLGDPLTVTAGGKRMKLTFRAASALPAVYITTESGSLSAIHADKDHKEPGTIRIVEADGTVAYAGDLKQIKGRGNTTWDYEKKPYNIKLVDKADLFGMDESKNWCLLANFRDTSYVRNAIVFDYALEMGVPNTTDTQSFDLYINGEYQGLYQMTEKMEVGDHRLEVPDLEQLNEKANPEKKLSDFPVIETENTRSAALPVTPAERNGFMLELDFPERWAEEASGFVTKDGQHVVVKSPEHASAEQVEYVRALVQEFEDLLFAGDERYLDYIDLDSWVQLYLIEEIFEDVDCGLSSIYFYVMDGKLYAGPLWDFDLTMGGSYAVTNPSTLYAAWRERTERYISHWLPELYKQESFLARVKELYADGWDTALDDYAGRAESYVANIAASAAMDADRWGKDHKVTLEQGAYLRDYLAARREFLHSIWTEGVSYHRVRLMGNVYTRYYENAVKDGELFDNFPSLYKEGQKLVGWFHERTDEPFDAQKPITEDTFLYAKWK
ncbi:MAG: hypothetical protein E7445_06455 [Ruminococcaceae bacterium]|nr:hypothetical protein [Oscillospiraceae bacterium]